MHLFHTIPSSIKGTLAQGLDGIHSKVDRKIQHSSCSITGCDGTALNIGHFLFGENRVGCGQQHLVLICKFHHWKTPFARTSAQGRRITYQDYSITAEKQQESAER